MDKGRQKQPKGSGDAGDSGNPKAEGGSLSPGSIVVDSRGRNVWYFHGEAIDSTSMMLQRLENPALALEPTRKTKQLDAGAGSSGSRTPAGKVSAAQTLAGKGSATRPAGAGAAASAPQGRRDSGRREDPAGTSRSFEQSFRVKPGKNSGGGFDPYNRS
jgi:hypothetical protein